MGTIYEAVFLGTRYEVVVGDASFVPWKMFESPQEELEARDEEKRMWAAEEVRKWARMYESTGDDEDARYANILVRAADEIENGRLQVKVEPFKEEKEENE